MANPGGDSPVRQALRSSAILSEIIRAKVQEAVPPQRGVGLNVYIEIRDGVVTVSQLNFRFSSPPVSSSSP